VTACFLGPPLCPHSGGWGCCVYYPPQTIFPQKYTSGVHYWCMANISISGWHCDVCGHEWISRTDAKPARCGKCKSPYWDRGSKDGDRQVVDDDSKREARGKGKRAAVPVLPKAKSKAKRLHPVLPVRSELAGGGGHLQEPGNRAHEKCRVYGAGNQKYCSDHGVYF
jgi:hypothetical protein